MQRSTLLNVLEGVRAAASTKSTAPAFSAVFFNGKTATTYDGELAIIAPCKVKLKGGVDLKTMLTWASNCSGDIVSIEQEGDEATLKCGRSRIKVVLLHRDQLTFNLPSGTGIELRDVEKFVAAIRRTAEFMGNDPAHPSRQGITVAGEDLARLYATDDLSMTEQTVKVDGGEGTIEAVLPPRFVKAMVTLDDISAIEFGDGWVTASVEDSTEGVLTLFSRTGNEIDVAAYERVVSETSAGDAADGTEVTEELVTMLKSVTAVLTSMGQAEVHVVIDDGEMKLESGDGFSTRVEETIEVDHHNADGWIVAKELLRAVEKADCFQLRGEAFVAWGKGFINLVSVSSE